MACQITRLQLFLICYEIVHMYLPTTTFMRSHLITTISMLWIKKAVDVWQKNQNVQQWLTRGCAIDIAKYGNLATD